MSYGMEIEVFNTIEEAKSFVNDFFIYAGKSYDKGRVTVNESVVFDNYDDAVDYVESSRKSIIIVPFMEHLEKKPTKAMQNNQAKIDKINREIYALSDGKHEKQVKALSKKKEALWRKLREQTRKNVEKKATKQYLASVYYCN